MCEKWKNHLKLKYVHIIMLNAKKLKNPTKRQKLDKVSHNQIILFVRAQLNCKNTEEVNVK